MDKEIPDVAELQNLIIRNVTEMGAMGAELVQQNIKISLLEEKIQKLQNEIELKNNEIKELQKTTDTFKRS